MADKNPNAGRFTWHELMTTDAAGAVAFYEKLFGWTVQEMDMGPAGKYRIFSKGDQGVCGAMTAPPGTPPHWLAYVGARDTNAAVKKIAELGGKILVPATDVPNMVRFAVAMDPQGAAFGVVQNIGEAREEPLGDAPPKPGTVCWNELHTSDLDAAIKYYGGLFGWTGKFGEGPMKYWHWQHGGKEMAGMMPLQMPNVPPNWLVYFAESDVDGAAAKVKDLGGRVVMPAMEMPKVGKFAIVQDPAGATFALFRSARV